MKKQSKLVFGNLTETKQRLGRRELGEVQLKHVTGGMLADSGGGTCTTCNDCDC